MILILEFEEFFLILKDPGGCRLSNFKYTGRSNFLESTELNINGVLICSMIFFSIYYYQESQTVISYTKNKCPISRQFSKTWKHISDFVACYVRHTRYIWHEKHFSVFPTLIEKEKCENKQKFYQLVAIFWIFSISLLVHQSWQHWFFFVQRDNALIQKLSNYFFLVQ